MSWRYGWYYELEKIEIKDSYIAGWYYGPTTDYFFAWNYVWSYTGDGSWGYGWHAEYGWAWSTVSGTGYYDIEASFAGGFDIPGGLYWVDYWGYGTIYFQLEPWSYSSGWDYGWYYDYDSWYALEFYDYGLIEFNYRGDFTIEVYDWYYGWYYDWGWDPWGWSWSSWAWSSWAYGWYYSNGWEYGWYVS